MTDRRSGPEPRPENRLGGEKSPYLLQHKHNPVDWYPWGDEAFARARTDDKPVLLSIGYAACHWCHVMAHESFEDEATAALMNELFVSIKVDREERPDVDAVYMNALTLMGQHGGWPLTMFLTPKGEPFLGGTYFPPAPRYGHPGFPDVLRSVSRLYATGRDRVGENVTAVADALARMSRVPEKRHAGLHSPSQLDALAQDALQIMDLAHGGTQGAPKFPQPSLLKFLWHAHRRTKDATLARAVTVSLNEMCQGGIYDHLGGGFARYATDERWLVPHFEKMLYDNAQLVELMTLVWSTTQDALYEVRIRETVGWVLRELATPEGAFAGTLDADSEGEEGKFYVWTEAEIDAVLGAEAPRFKAAYDVTPGGNWEGHTILNRSHELALGNAAHEAVLKRGREKLLARRAGRVRPGLDDKILTDWNGMMIAALAGASHVFGEPAWLTAAETAYRFIATKMQADGRLRHSYRDGAFVARDVIDDYAQMIRAALMLHQATGAARYLDDALAWLGVADAHFWDTESGGYFFSADDASDLVARTRTAFDNATPSGNGTMVENLARLYYLTGDAAHRDRGDAIVDVFTRQPPQHYVNMPGILLGYEMLAAAVQVVVIGKPDDADRTALARVAAASGVPTLVLAQIDAAQALPEGHAAHGKTMLEGRTTAYVCRGAVCGLPQTSPNALKEELART